MKIFLLILTFCFCNLQIFSDSKKSSVLYYTGLFINSDLVPISIYGDIAYKDSYINVIGYNYRLAPTIKFLQFETEALLGKHSGFMNHVEGDALFIARTKRFSFLPISFALGEGLSLASKSPALEYKKLGFDRERGLFNFTNVEETRPLLNFLMLELDVKLPSDWFPKVFIRLHHRSGIWGTYCPPDPPCGSNFLTYGIKLSI